MKLFERLGRSIALTPEGETLLHFSKKLLLIREEAKQRLSRMGGKTCTLTVRIPQSLASYQLPRVLERYWEQYPYVRFNFADCAFTELTGELYVGTTDVALLLADSLSVKELNARLIGSQQLVYIMAKQHRLAGMEDLSVRDIKGERFFMPTHDCSYRMQLERALGDNSDETYVTECSSMETLKRCVSCGLGVAMVPRPVAEEMAGTCVYIPSKDSFSEVGELLILHKDKWISEEIAYFIELFEKSFAS